MGIAPIVAGLVSSQRIWITLGLDCPDAASKAPKSRSWVKTMQSSCRSGPSPCHSEREFLFLRSPCAISKRGGNILLLKIGIQGQDIFAGFPCGHKPDDHADGDPHPADTRLPPHDRGIESNPFNVREFHGEEISSYRGVVEPLFSNRITL